jgi:hypothetical protein
VVPNSRKYGAAAPCGSTTSAIGSQTRCCGDVSVRRSRAISSISVFVIVGSVPRSAMFSTGLSGSPV